MTRAGDPQPPVCMPAEWEPHEATFLTWPHERSDWPGKMAAIPWAYAEMTRILARGERVRILATTRIEARAAAMLRASGVEMGSVEFLRIATDRSWVRDYGPIFVRDGGGLRIARFRFNGWARYAKWRKDDAVPVRVARALGAPIREVRHAGRAVVLEGGGIDVNGRGTLLTTEECWLHPSVQVRNAWAGREALEEVFRDALGARRTIWLGRGVAGMDDTHGHIDDVCRFVDRRTVVLCREDDPSDPNHAIMRENRERLEVARLEDGSRIGIVDLPMPRPVFFNGHRLPASYANFYIANAAVLVPVFNDPADRDALGVLADLFADREVVGVYARDLVWGFGSIHCLTQQQPAGRKFHG